MSDFQTAIDSSAQTSEPKAGDGFEGLESEYNSYLEQDGDEIKVSRKRFQELAQEHKNYRQKWGETARMFDGYDPEQVKTFGAFLGMVNSDDTAQQKQAVEWMRSQLDGLSPAEKREAIAEIKEQAQDAGFTAKEVKEVTAALKAEDVDRLVEEKLQKALSDRDKQSEIDRTVAEIGSHAQHLAAEHGIDEWAQPGTDLYDMLLLKAQRIGQTEKLAVKDAMNKAAEQILERITVAGQNLMSKKVAGAPKAASPKAGVEPRGQAVQPTSFEEARKAAMSRLGAQPGR